MDKPTLASFLDFANHRAETTPEDIKALCQKVKKYGFHSAFVNSCYLWLAQEILAGKAKLGTVVSFPLGQDLRGLKILAAIEAVRKGADELDVSLNVGMFKAGKTEEVLEEMKAIVGAVKNLRPKALVKFIIETGLLSEDQIKQASELVLKSEADFIKTSSGFGPRGASLKDVELIKAAVGDKIKIKAAGGIGSYQKAIDFISAGVVRIGTSKAVEIVHPQGVNII